MTKAKVTKKRTAKKATKRVSRTATAKKPAALVRRRPARRRVALAPAALPEGVALASMGLGAAGFTPGDKEQLAASFTDDQFDLLPSGLAYVSHIHCRRRLTEIFGAGDWGMMSRGEPQAHGAMVLQRWVLLVRGRPVGEAHGEARHVATNRQSSRGKALEGAKSNALTRICKDLMPLEPWDRTWQFQYRLRQGVCVDVRGGAGIDQQWRRWNAPPLAGEIGIHDSSPNQDRYVAPTEARRLAATATYRSEEDATAAADVRAEAQAVVPYADAPIGADSAAHRAIRGAMRTHGVSEADVKGYIKATWGYTSTRQILKSQHGALVKWIKMPNEYASGEVVE